MAARTPHAVAHIPHPFDIKRKTLSVRSLEYKSSSTSSFAQLAERVRGEFAEMRGFSPTMEQAARLFDLNRDECHRILGALVQEGFLRRTPDGRYRLPA